MEFGRFQAVSFDCYGTLIDWQTGILRAMKPALVRAGVIMTDNAILRDYAVRERQAEQPPYKSYRAVLEEVAAGMLANGNNGDAGALSKSLASPGESGWPAFEDTAEALVRLRRHVKIAIVSNVDDDLFAATRPWLGIGYPDPPLTFLHSSQGTGSSAS